MDAPAVRWRCFDNIFRAHLMQVVSPGRNTGFSQARARTVPQQWLWGHRRWERCPCRRMAWTGRRRGADRSVAPDAHGRTCMCACMTTWLFLRRTMVRQNSKTEFTATAPDALHVIAHNSHKSPTSAHMPPGYPRWTSERQA